MENKNVNNPTNNKVNAGFSIEAGTEIEAEVKIKDRSLESELAQWQFQIQVTFEKAQRLAEPNQVLSDEAFECWESFQALDSNFQAWFKVNIQPLQSLAEGNPAIRSSLVALNSLYTQIVAQCEQYRSFCLQDSQKNRKQVSSANAYQNIQKIGLGR